MISADARLRLNPCCAVEQKRTVERTADLRRIRRCVLRSPSGMYTVSMCWPSSSSSTHLVVPSQRRLVKHDRGQARSPPHRASARAPPWHVGHGVEIGHAVLVDPLQHIATVKRLGAQLDEKGLHALFGQAQQVDLGRVVIANRAQRVRSHTPSGKKKAISTVAVSGPSEPCTAFSSTVCGMIGADGAGCGLLAGWSRPSAHGSWRWRSRLRAPGP